MSLWWLETTPEPKPDPEPEEPFIHVDVIVNGKIAFPMKIHNNVVDWIEGIVLDERREEIGMEMTQMLEYLYSIRA